MGCRPSFRHLRLRELAHKACCRVRRELCIRHIWVEEDCHIRVALRDSQDLQTQNVRFPVCYSPYSSSILHREPRYVLGGARDTWDMLML